MATMLVAACAWLPARPARGGAQEIADPVVARALTLEGDGDVRAAAPLYRRALAGRDPVAALLGLERVYAELGITDSLVAPLDSVVRRLPADPTVRAVQLRTFQSLGREEALRAAASEWMRAAPGDPAPFRELARLHLGARRLAAADSVIAAAIHALGSATALAAETAQLRAASGQWVGAAESWRTTLTTDEWMAESAAYSLTPAPDSVRAAIRGVFGRDPVAPAARLALASLETRWGSTGRGWEALRDLPPDSASALAWMAFGERAEAEGRWLEARTAFEAVLRWRPDEALSVRAATAAAAGGDPAAVLTLAPLPARTADSLELARERVPLHVRALARLGRPADAAALAAAFDRFLTPGARTALGRDVAMAWVRRGHLRRASAALAAGDAGDSSAAAGWIALFEGDAETARAYLGRGDERTADVALALAILARERGRSAPAIGAAFHALARGDTTGAAKAFSAAADSAPAAASLLELVAARLSMATGDTAAAVAGWRSVATVHRDSPEAPEALLALGRTLLVQGHRDEALAQLEQLILSHPGSALVPAARRELEAARGSPSAAP